MVDSRIENYKHIRVVSRLLNKVIKNLLKRADSHDSSKLVSPEKEIFDLFTDKLSGTTYGSTEYDELKKLMDGALAHHYRLNSHHPEHYENGIDGMSLLDIIEMLVDWIAATERHDDGDIRKSIEINQLRFKYNDQLKNIFLNTVKELESE